MRNTLPPLEDDGLGGSHTMRDCVVDWACGMLLEDSRALDAREITQADYEHRRAIHQQFLLVALIPEAGDA